MVKLRVCKNCGNNLIKNHVGWYCNKKSCPIRFVTQYPIERQTKLEVEGDDRKIK